MTVDFDRVRSLGGDDIWCWLHRESRHLREEIFCVIALG